MQVNTETHWIARRRLALNLKQDEVASQLRERGIEVNRASVSHWENGKANPPFQDPKFRQALAEVLQMSVREVLIQAGYEVNTPISESTVQLAELIDDLTSEQKLVVQRIVEMMRDAEKTAQIDIRMLISVGGESTVLPFPLQSDKNK